MIISSNAIISSVQNTNIRMSQHAMESEKRLKGVEKCLAKLNEPENVLKSPYFYNRSQQMPDIGYRYQIYVSYIEASAKKLKYFHGRIQNSTLM